MSLQTEVHKGTLSVSEFQSDGTATEKARRVSLMSAVMLVLDLGLGLETKSLALALCPQVLVVLNIVQV